jgi:hypothetical protein
MRSVNFQKNENREVILSILLPAYNYPLGIQKILDYLKLPDDSELKSKVEIIIFDNSIDACVESQIETTLKKNKHIVYKNYSYKSVACKNWNKLIDKAHGVYYILMHHDEFPLTKNFISKAIEEIEEHKDIDVIIMDCIVMNKSVGSLRPHVPSFIRKKVFENFPRWLFIRNAIGPTATLIVKRSLHSGFDCRLEWLIDVDEYYSIRKRAKSWIFSNNLLVGSYTDRDESITSSLKGKIKNIRRDELKYLYKKHRLRENRFYFCMVIILWVGMRVITRPYWYIMNRIGKYPVPTAVVKKAFK